MVWVIMFLVFIGCGDVMFGVMVFGRFSELFGVEMMIGLFINMVLLWVCLDVCVIVGG